MLFKLLGLPFSLPAAGIKFVFQQVADLADRELYDESVVHEQLLLLQVQLEEGDIDDDEYVAREAELMQRLREVRQWRERLGKGTSGGPVRVAAPSAEVSFGDEPAAEQGEAERDEEA
jgi:hypothetical protein